MAYDNTNRGAIWKNEDKTNERQPDFTGTINVNGKDYKLAGWNKRAGAKHHAPVMTFKVEEKQPRIQEQPKDFVDDPLPF